MKQIISWLNEALSAKDLTTGMTYYRVANQQISATDGRITACHPWPYPGDFLVPGNEFEKLLNRMPTNPELIPLEQGVKLKAGRFSGSIHTLPLTDWDYPGVEDAIWAPLPSGLLPLLKILRPFISDNAVQPWATCVALEDGWAYATNNIAIAGAPMAGLGAVKALLPSWAIDFALTRAQGLAYWAWTPSYMAFQWENGAWMRSQLAVGAFPEKAAALVRTAQTEIPTQEITTEFRQAFDQIVALAEDTIQIYADRVQSKFGKAEIEGEAECEVPDGSPCSIWGASFLAPALTCATHWSPGVWPKPAPFKGSVVAGYVVGRKM